MRRYLIIIGILFGVIHFGSVLSIAQAIKIGVSGPLSAPLSSYGIPTLRAVQIVVSKLNLAGGVNGETIEIISQDDFCSASQAETVANSFVASGVIAVIGHICSGATAAALPIYKASNILTISPGSTTPDLTQSGTYPNFFRTIPHDSLQADIQSKYILNVLGTSKIALVHDGTDYGKGLIDLSKANIEKSGGKTVSYYGSITPGLTDYSAAVQSIISSGAELLIYGGYWPEASIILNQIRGQGSNILFVSGDGVKSTDFLNVSGTNAEGSFLSSTQDYFVEYLANEAKQEYIDQYAEEPGPFYYNAYSAALALFSAIDQSNSTNINSVKDILQSENFFTPLGRITFDNNGDILNSGFSLYMVQSNEYVEVFTGKYTEDQLIQIKQNERKRWDVNNNNTVDLIDSIHAIQIMSGFKGN
jgi:branched-chain amino acid transport system substrate-binding protein